MDVGYINTSIVVRPSSRVGPPHVQNLKFRAWNLAFGEVYRYGLVLIAPALFKGLINSSRSSSALGKILSKIP